LNIPVFGSERFVVGNEVELDHFCILI
jgi:hypothetical protein